MSLAMCLATSGALFSQDITATISGTITDASGSGITNAKVTVYNVDRQIEERSVKTSGSGTYVAPLLPIGKYRLTVEAAGFKKAVREEISTECKR